MEASWAEEGCVYLLEASMVGLVKVGHTRGHPERRALALEIGSPVTLERALHRRFAPLRHHGEWFALEGELLAFARGPDVLPWPGPAPTAEEVRAARASDPDAIFTPLEASAVLGLTLAQLRGRLESQGMPTRAIPARDVAFLEELARAEVAERESRARSQRELAAKLAQIHASGYPLLRGRRASRLPIPPSPPAPHN